MKTLMLLALLGLAFLNHSDGEQDDAMEKEASAKPVAAKAREPLPLCYRVPTPTIVVAPESWTAQEMGLSPAVVALLDRLDRERVAVFERWSFEQRSTLYSVPGPRKTTAYYYLQRLCMEDRGCFHIFLEDREHETITTAPVTYCSTWCSYTPPQPRFVDLDGDGVEELVTQDYFHNGTALNLYMDTYWSVAEDLSLKPVLKIAKRDEGIRIVEGAWGTMNRKLFRPRVKPETPVLFVEVLWNPSPATAPERVLGRACLRRDPKSGTWYDSLVIHGLDSAPWIEQVDSVGPRSNF